MNNVTKFGAVLLFEHCPNEERPENEAITKLLYSTRGRLATAPEDLSKSASSRDMQDSDKSAFSRAIIQSQRRVPQLRASNAGPSTSGTCCSRVTDEQCTPVTGIA